MSAGSLVAVALAGGAGAVARLLLDVAVTARGRGRFPAGTLAVNLSGAFALGLLAGAALDDRVAATGFLGAYTTFSTWMLETHRLRERGRPALAVLNVVVSLVLGVALAWAGRALGAAL